ncbi:cytochrome P450 [Archangium lipolyticum]|uniref:cytochrome P450 n=1 Tax=Archangium lipolyticum TaxID=2970465 RepID=UPI002149E8D1|nr:cytochrome P450 [Archangium lipolyticum]
MLPLKRWSPDDEYDLLSPSFRQDPYPVLHRLRAEEPVHFSEQLQAWVVTRHDDVLTGLAHSSISADRISPRLLQFPEHHRPKFRPLTRLLSMWALMLDRPDHNRFRTLITKAMTRPIIMGFRPMIERIASELVDEAIARGGMEAMADLALPLPLYVIAEIIGVPRESIGLLKRCALDIVNFFGTPPATYLPTADVAMRTVLETADHLRDLIREREREPRPDLISGLLAAREAGEALEDDEIIATCILMVFAGFETTCNLLGNGILLLAKHPEQFALLRSRPSLMRGAVDEILRYETPVQRLSRMALGDLVLRGRTIRRNDLIFFMSSAANRDPAIFSDPDRFDITRDSTQHIAFGHWIHTCPGSTLAHLEASIVFGELCRRVSGLRLESEGPPQWQQNLSVRSLQSLQVRFR